MPTLEEIKAQLQHLDGTSKFLGRKEIKELPAILWEDEKLEKLVQGRYGNGMGVLVATNKRLVFVDKGLISLRVEDFPYKNVSSIQYQTGMVFGKITIFTSGNKADIDQIDKKQAKDFAEYVRNRISNYETKEAPVDSTVSTTPVQSGEDFISQLERLATLKEKGILSEEEFQSQKQRILAGK